MGCRNKFIKVFVNEMYAILIGIGIGNVLFASEFNFKNMLSVVSLLFVTAIVVTYWWDWTEYVEGEVSSTKREMLLDFSLLIALEMLFAYYSSMQTITYIFFSIAIIDLLWVLNHFYETKMYKGDKIQRKRTVTWLIEKFVAIAVYVGLVFLVKLTTIYVPEKIVDYITLAEVIVAFITVRQLSFSQIHKTSIKKVKFAKAIHTDEILNINHSYFACENQGLLLKKYSQNEIEKIIEEKRIYIAIDVENVVMGYCVINDHIKQEIFNETQPIVVDKYNNLKKEKIVYIEQIAVMKNFEKNGIASSIVKHIFNLHPHKVIVSYVATKPFENKDSIKFHKNNGFVKTGIFERKFFADRENYQSFLFVRE